MKLITLTLLALAGTVAADIFAEVDIMQHLNKLYEHRYPSASNEDTRDAVRTYIKDQFAYFGLDVQEHKFNTTVSEGPSGLSSLVTVDGTNIIGIKPAVTKQSGAVVLVGADYDSNGISDPLFYNGAGVAALLEAAHIYAFNAQWSGRYAQNFTTIFVAFDINTKHYLGSTGYPGGKMFVKEWLWPFIEKNADYFGGAIILDSIMNVHYEENTQTLTQNFNSLFPETNGRVIGSQYKGDFLAMVSLGGHSDSTTLKDQYMAAFNRDRLRKRYRLEDMVLKNGAALDPFVTLVLKSENVHFWTFKNESGTTIHLPAILLTDTSNYRMFPELCATCRPADLITEERLEFVNATIVATTHFLLDRQATLLPPKENSGPVSSLPSVAMTVLMMTLVRLYM